MLQRSQLTRQRGQGVVIEDEGSKPGEATELGRQTGQPAATQVEVLQAREITDRIGKACEGIGREGEVAQRRQRRQRGELVAADLKGLERGARSDG